MRESGFMKTRGFTLIELLAVITVLALLLTLAVPSILNAQKNAQTGLNTTQKKNVKLAGETVGIDVDDYMSDIYNCSGWIASKCTKDDTGKWSSITLSMEDLTAHEYFEDQNNHCSGNIIISKNNSGYAVDFSNVICK